MPNQNAFDSNAQNNSDGGQIGMGLTFSRLFKWLGANITIQGNGAAVVTFPSGTATLLSTQLNEFGSLLPNKTLITGSDAILIEDSQNGFTKAYLSAASLGQSPIFSVSSFGPAFTAGANAVGPSGSGNWFYWRFGDLILLMGSFSFGATVANTLTTVTWTLPVPSNFVLVQDMVGFAGQQAQTEAGGVIQANAANNTASFTYFPSATTYRVYRAFLMYRIR